MTRAPYTPSSADLDRAADELAAISPDLATYRAIRARATANVVHRWRAAYGPLDNAARHLAYARNRHAATRGDVPQPLAALRAALRSAHMQATT